jgi:isoquinoline 1-oxidoreductase subunit alpha
MSNETNTKITLSVNKEKYQVEVSTEMPLLWAIRDLVGLTGTKFGCGQALCGACIVHLDGAPIRSCVTPAVVASGKEITTIEGIPETHPIKKAWIETNVPQCGYCQPGQIMSAVGLVSKNKKPTSSQIDEAMSGNICRCGTYGRIKCAIQKACGLKKVEAV